MNPHTVDVRGAADMMKVHPKTVLDMIEKQELRAARIGRAYVLLARDVLEHIERSIMQQTAKRFGEPARRERRGRRAAMA